MKKRILAVLLASAMSFSLMAGCGPSDQEAADKVAKMIDAIYVQERTEDTDKQCAEAKKAWDALTDKQKEMVEGEYADPDYFGRDTGDASKDDIRNKDEIGDKEILVASFGTSFNDSRVKDIKGIEDALQEAYPDWSVRRAFTAQIIINHIQAREGAAIDNVEQALDRAVANKVKELIIQPTHLMHGAEYDELMEAVETYKDKFERIEVAEPLLGEVGKDATVINADKKAVAEAVTAEALKTAGFADIQAAKDASTAFVFLGHGTTHTAKVSYSQMQTQMDKLGYDNVFIGTVEGEPEETACEAVIEAISAAGYKNVVLRPLMVVAGDHANNDMAGAEDDTWLTMFQNSKKFDKVDTQIAGLGQIEAIQKLYIAHTGALVNVLPDGEYETQFDTDSKMFRVNEALDGKGKLTVKDGKMMIHISLGSKNILNLFPGLAEDAKKEGAAILQPTIDTVTYSDGTTEEVHGFDVPVPALDQEFDLALIGKKGKWYDHKVVVKTPEGAPAQAALEDGAYTIEFDFEGGSGKAKIQSPANLKVEGGKATATLEWSSKNYDYMLVGGEKYLKTNTDGNSVFEVPVEAFDTPVKMIGNTTAMSKPHEIEYTLTFHTDTMKPVK